MSTIDELLENASRYAADPDGYTAAGKPGKPSRRLAIVTCMDARIDPAAILGLEEGDAHVIRNAGGIVTDDTIRSLSASQHLLETDDVMVIQHTECGLLNASDADYDDLMRERVGRRPSWGLRAFTDLEASVRESLATIAESAFLPTRGEARGFIFDVSSGELREVN
jgi:carbonic anhydrase